MSSKTVSCMSLKIEYHLAMSPFFFTSLILKRLGYSSSSPCSSWNVILTSRSSATILKYFLSRFCSSYIWFSKYSELNSFKSSHIVPGETSISWSVISLNLYNSKFFSELWRTTSRSGSSIARELASSRDELAVFYDRSS